MRRALFFKPLGLMEPKPASKKLREYLLDILELWDVPDVEIMSSGSSRHRQEAVSCTGDVVYIRCAQTGALCAGHVWAHVTMSGEAITLVEEPVSYTHLTLPTICSV